MTNIITKKSLLLIFLFLSLTFAQEKTSIDTFIPPELFEYQMSKSPFLNKLIFSSTFPDDTTSKWLKTKFLLINFSYNQNNFESSPSQMIEPLYNKYLESQKFAAYRTILSSMQIGATAYLAYLHLKKYGFLKKK